MRDNQEDRRRLAMLTATDALSRTDELIAQFNTAVETGDVVAKVRIRAAAKEEIERLDKLIARRPATHQTASTKDIAMSQPRASEEIQALWKRALSQAKEPVLKRSPTPVDYTQAEKIGLWRKAFQSANEIGE